MAKRRELFIAHRETVISINLIFSEEGIVTLQLIKNWYSLNWKCLFLLLRYLQQTNKNTLLTDGKKKCTHKKFQNCQTLIRWHSPKYSITTFCLKFCIFFLKKRHTRTEPSRTEGQDHKCISTRFHNQHIGYNHTQSFANVTDGKSTKLPVRRTNQYRELPFSKFSAHNVSVWIVSFSLFRSVYLIVFVTPDSVTQRFNNAWLHIPFP